MRLITCKCKGEKNHYEISILHNYQYCKYGKKVIQIQYLGTKTIIIINFNMADDANIRYKPIVLYIGKTLTLHARIIK